jgi:hypothetical protein
VGFLLGTVTVAAGVWVLSNTTEGERIANEGHQAITRVWERLAARVPNATPAFPSRVRVTESGGRTWRLRETPAAALPLVATTTEVEGEAPAPAQSGADTLSASHSVPVVEPTRRWHTFWHAFQRKTSAQGFADRLAAVTGLEFTVIDQGDGSHAVAFAYQGEDERSAHLVHIRARTGLTVAAE